MLSVNVNMNVNEVMRVKLKREKAHSSAYPVHNTSGPILLCPHAASGLCVALCTTMKNLLSADTSLVFGADTSLVHAEPSSPICEARKELFTSLVERRGALSMYEARNWLEYKARIGT